MRLAWSYSLGMHPAPSSLIQYMGSIYKERLYLYLSSVSRVSKCRPINWVWRHPSPLWAPFSGSTLAGTLWGVASMPGHPRRLRSRMPGIDMTAQSFPAPSAGCKWSGASTKVWDREGLSSTQWLQVWPPLDQSINVCLSTYLHIK